MLIPFNELFSRHHVKPAGVLHLGANTGQEAEAYAEQGIKQVVWVEALPDIYAQLVRNVRKYPGSVALCACLGDTNGKDVTFHVANNEAQSSSMLEFGTHSKEHPSVKYIQDLPMSTIRVDTLLRNHGIEIDCGWFLNVDLQGAELLALRGMGNLITKFKYAYIEVNERELYKGCPLVDDIDRYLAQFGFAGKETKMTRNGWGDRFYIRN